MNRLDAVVVSHPLKCDELEEVLEIELGQVQTRISDSKAHPFLFRIPCVVRSRQTLLSYKKRYDTLSRRQHQVLTLVVSGLLNKQIASELGTTLVTVKLHRAQMMRKARSLAEIVRMAEKLRLFPST